MLMTNVVSRRYDQMTLRAYYHLTKAESARQLHRVNVPLHVHKDNPVFGGDANFKFCRTILNDN
jgi:hypothetical protein